MYLMGIINVNVEISATSIAEWKLAFKNPWRIPDRNKERSKSPCLLIFFLFQTKS